LAGVAELADAADLKSAGAILVGSSPTPGTLPVVSLPCHHYNGAMENGVVTTDWSFFLAIATFVLAGVAVWSILQVRGIRRDEKRQKLLDAIIDWANGVVQDVIEPKHKQIEKLRGHISLYSKGKYIIDMASTFGERLGALAKDVNSHIALAIRLPLDLMELRKVKEELLKDDPWLRDEIVSDEITSKAIETLPHIEHSIYLSAITLMREATRIKTKGIT
jgi:hypothetical protein